MNSVLHNHIYLTTNINLPKMFITELIRSNKWLVAFDTHYEEDEVLVKKVMSWEGVRREFDLR